MAGPLVKVDTLMNAIALDLGRTLRLGAPTLELIVPDNTEGDGFRVLFTATKNFNKVSLNEDDGTEGVDVVYQYADMEDDVDLESHVRVRDLHIRVLEDVYKVARVPPIAADEPLVYTFICGERMTRANFDSTK